MVKLCEHLSALKIEKVANTIRKASLYCTGNKKHSGATLNICLQCGQTRCVDANDQTRCSYQHSYGTKHILAYNLQEDKIYCFACQTQIGETLQGDTGKKAAKIEEIYEKVRELGRKKMEEGNQKQQIQIINQKQEKHAQIDKKQQKKSQKSYVRESKFSEQPQSRLSTISSQLNIFGLTNLGNTCFFNSIIQCLYASIAFHIRYPQMNFGEGGSKCEINNVFKKFLLNKEKHFLPKGLFSCVCKGKAMYKHMDQQDAQQMLGVLLNGLIDGQAHLLKLENVKHSESQDQQDENEQKKEDEGQIKCHRKNTTTEKMFGFYLASRLYCLHCDKVSWNMDFSLQIPVELTKHSKNLKWSQQFPQGQDIPKEEIGKSGLKYPSPSEIEQFIDPFFTIQSFTKSNYFKCQKCSQSSSLRKFYLHSPPQSLIISLKRFHNNGSKNCASVNFGLQIDLSPYCIDEGSHIYELYGIVVHGGTAKGGHYIACSRRGDKWYYFSDSSVKQTSWNAVKRMEPYILFYQKV